MYEDSLKCNEYIPYNYTAYYDEAEEWAQTMNNVTCAFLESVQIDQESANEVVSSSSYSMSFYKSYANSQSISGGNFYVAGAAVALVGAAVVAIRHQNQKTIGQDLDTAFVYGEHATV